MNIFRRMREHFIEKKQSEKSEKSEKSFLITTCSQNAIKGTKRSRNTTQYKWSLKRKCRINYRTFAKKTA